MVELLRKAQRLQTQEQKLHCVHPQQKLEFYQLNLDYLVQNLLLRSLLTVEPHLRLL